MGTRSTHNNIQTQGGDANAAVFGPQDRGCAAGTITVHARSDRSFEMQKSRDRVVVI